jgi:nucleoside 2-deoxyribosyltransferase
MSGTKMSGTKVYLAGPEVFLRDAAAVEAQKKALCEAYNLEGLFPFDSEVGSSATDMAIFHGNVELIRSADFGVFNLTPFRGSGADVGTVFELGLMTGANKPCFGYTNDVRDLRERVASTTEIFHNASDGTWRDHLDMTVEDFAQR